MASHAITRTGAGGTTAAAITQIGADITLPAGGPWVIHHVFGQVVKVTTIPDQGTGGALIVNSASGDITPDPAPGEYPLIGSPGTTSANAANVQVPLNIFEVDWSAAGKAVIQMSYLNQLAITTASQVAVGILFGTERPAMRPLKFCDGVRTAFASASEQSVGTITLAEKATRIVGVLADLNHGEATTAAEAALATVRIASDDISFPPFSIPCNRGFDAADGSAAGGSSVPQSQFIPLDIPVVGGARLDIFATTTQSVTGNVEVQVYIAYE